MVFGLLAGLAALIAAIAYRKEKKRKQRCGCGGKNSVQPYPEARDNYSYRDQPNPNEKGYGYRGNNEIEPPRYEQPYSMREYTGDNKVQDRYHHIPVTDEKAVQRMDYRESVESQGYQAGYGKT